MYVSLRSFAFARLDQPATVFRGVRNGCRTERCGKIRIRNGHGWHDIFVTEAAMSGRVSECCIRVRLCLRGHGKDSFEWVSSSRGKGFSPRQWKQNALATRAVPGKLSFSRKEGTGERAAKNDYLMVIFQKDRCQRNIRYPGRLGETNPQRSRRKLTSCS